MQKNISETLNHCINCGLEYNFINNGFKYNHDKILYEAYKKKYLLNRVLNNNSFIGYKFLSKDSLSYSDRSDVLRFKSYIIKYAKGGNLLDIGCGPLETPGYLSFDNVEQFSIYGIDPLDIEPGYSFLGYRVVGCAEYMPFIDNYFDTIICATSLDHTCSLDKTIDEIRRVLSINGVFIIWMGDRSRKITQYIKLKLYQIFRYFKDGYRIDKYVMYPNYTTLYVPKGAVDPFHMYNESPKILDKILKNKNFERLDISYNNRDEVFLCYCKK